MSGVEFLILVVISILWYLTISLGYHIYKLEALVKSIFENPDDFDEIMDELNFKGGHDTERKR